MDRLPHNHPKAIRTCTRLVKNQRHQHTRCMIRSRVGYARSLARRHAPISSSVVNLYSVSPTLTTWADFKCVETTTSMASNLHPTAGHCTWCAQCCAHSATGTTTSHVLHGRVRPIATLATIIQHDSSMKRQQCQLQPHIQRKTLTSPMTRTRHGNRK